MGPSRRKSVAALLLALYASPANADEGGVSFWLPGEFGSLAAAPLVPGWSIGIINIYEQSSASGAVAAAREITINNLKSNVNVNLNLQRIPVKLTRSRRGGSSCGILHEKVSVRKHRHVGIE